MTHTPLAFVFLGLSLSSSWGNGHATNYRALLAALAARGHRAVFLERNTPWYAQNRDLSSASYCRLHFYASLEELDRTHSAVVEQADVVIVGSYVPDGVAVIDWVLERTSGLVGFYDIDTPVTLAGLGSGRAEYVAADQLGRFDFYLSFAGGPCLAQLQSQYDVRRATAFYCMVDAGRYRPMSRPKLWDVGYMGTYSADRQGALEQLLIEPARRLPGRRFVVAGPQYPQEIEWPSNVDRIEHLPPERHAEFYSSLKFALNLTRADMRATGWSPSVRLFEAAACGTPALSDRWPGLNDLFPEGDAIVPVDTAADVTAALRMDDDERSRIGCRARQIVLAGHTGERRAETLEAVVAQAPTQSVEPAVVRENQHARES